MKPARSVRAKLMLVVITTTLAALLITGAAIAAFGARTYRQAALDDMLTQADLLGRASVPGLAFDDAKAANSALGIVQARPLIVEAALYTPRGNVFATFPENSSGVPPLPEADGVRIDGDEIVVFKRVVDHGQILGTVYLKGRYDFSRRMAAFLAILGSVMLASLVIAVLMSMWLNRAVTRPIRSVRDIARRVSETRDYSLRATRTSDDEIGELVDGFNAMLDEIGRRAEGLEQTNASLAREVQERRAVESALRLSEQRNLTLVSAVSAIVWHADQHGRFTDEQTSWCGYTGQDTTACRGSGWRDAIHAEDRGSVDMAWAGAIAEPAIFECELRLWHAASDRHRYVSMRAAPMFKPGGDVLEWIGTVDDIDDGRNAALELEQLNADLEQRVGRRTAELEAANKEMETFSYSVSHDLRAPVRAIIGFSQILAEDHGPQLDAEGLRKLGIIGGEAQRMGHLIDDLLAFSRLGRQAINPANLDMTGMARDMFERLCGQSNGRRPELRLESIPPAFADRALLDQVWANLIGNAVKYSGKREQALVEIGAISDDREHIYYVRDNGAGFDPRYKAKLFGVFQRLHDASEFSGTGVGLALVQRIVLRHHGRVWADGKPDKGATFYFTLPKETTDARG